MIININTQEVYELSVKLKQVASQMQEMITLYQGQLEEDQDFLGEMATQYQSHLRVLFKEHQNMILFYQELTKELNMIVRDFDDIESSYVSRIENI